MPRITKTTIVTKTTRVRKERPAAAAGTTGTVTIERSQAERYLARVPDEKAFWLHDGRVLRDMKDLRDALAGISEEDYKYHTGESKNDFSNWVREVIGDEHLARDLGSASDKEQAARIVDERYMYLMRQAESG